YRRSRFGEGDRSPLGKTMVIVLLVSVSVPRISHDCTPGAKPRPNPRSLASSSRSQAPGQAARAAVRLTSGVVSTVVCQRPWLVVVEVTDLVTRHQLDQPVAGPCHGRGCSGGRRRSALATAGRPWVRQS